MGRILYHGEEFDPLNSVSLRALTESEGVRFKPCSVTLNPKSPISECREHWMPDPSSVYKVISEYNGSSSWTPTPDWNSTPDIVLEVPAEVSHFDTHAQTPGQAHISWVGLSSFRLQPAKVPKSPVSVIGVVPPPLPLLFLDDSIGSCDETDENTVEAISEVETGSIISSLPDKVIAGAAHWTPDEPFHSGSINGQFALIWDSKVSVYRKFRETYFITIRTSWSEGRMSTTWTVGCTSEIIQEVLIGSYMSYSTPNWTVRYTVENREEGHAALARPITVLTTQTGLGATLTQPEYKALPHFLSEIATPGARAGRLSKVHPPNFAHIPPPEMRLNPLHPPVGSQGTIVSVTPFVDEPEMSLTFYR